MNEDLLDAIRTAAPGPKARPVTVAVLAGRTTAPGGKAHWLQDDIWAGIKHLMASGDLEKTDRSTPTLKGLSGFGFLLRLTRQGYLNRPTQRRARGECPFVDLTAPGAPQPGDTVKTELGDGSYVGPSHRYPHLGHGYADLGDGVRVTRILK